jgi:conjugative relaxase-like TrwC/TraI family protein
MSFAVPKSVSIAYALGDPLVQGEVVAGCEAAVAEAFGWLEREACFVRRGSNNRMVTRSSPEGFGTRRMVAAGFVAAQFRHRTSRLGDPHLHWHVLVPNMAQGIDGRWSALDGTALYAAQRTAGVMFQSAMRRELKQRLGVQWGPIRRDTAEIAGIPARLVREFSQRTEQIVEWMETRGVQGQPAKDEALLATRTSKREVGDVQSIEAAWRQRAEALAWGPQQLEQLLTGPAPSPASPYVVEEVNWRGGESTTMHRAVNFDTWLDWLLEHRLTAHETTFTRFDLTQAVAATLGPNLAANSVEAAVYRALASLAIVEVGDHWAERPAMHAPSRMVGDDRALRYTARSLLEVEQRLLTQLSAGTLAGVGLLERLTVETVLRGADLGPDQATAVRTITSAGDQVAVMVGRAGTGKTHTLGTLRDVYESAGWTVIGLAPSARAARELEGGSGIASTTIARHRVERRDVTAQTVVVIDEAGMAGTRDLAAILDQATTVGAKVVLVGDHHQLPEVAAGGAFRAAVGTLGDRVVELTVNRRQQHEWEQHALDQLRHGDVAAAFAAYRERGRVVIADQPNDLHGIALADWRDTRTSGETLMLAGTRAEAQLLNRVARRILADNGELDLSAQIEIAGRPYTIGDQVVLCRNHPAQRLTNGETFAVDNGMRGTVTGVDQAQMSVRLTSGDEVLLDGHYVARGWVDHAYALTIHKAQGATCDYVLVVGPAGLFREGAYVALSRAMQWARLYATRAQATELDERHGLGIPLPTENDPDPEAELLARLHVSGAKTLITIDDPDAALIDELAFSYPGPELFRLARHARHVEESVNVLNPAEQRASLDRARVARHHLAQARRVRAIDRDNVGHVLGIDDTAGTCSVHFENDRGHAATRPMPWGQLVVIDNPDAVDVPADALETLDRLERHVAGLEQAWAEALAEHDVEPGDADRYRRATHVAADRAAHELRSEQPAWLTTWLGPRPEYPSGAAVWDDAVARIAHHRCLYSVDPGEPGLGPRPVDSETAGRWQRLMLRLLEDRCWLDDHVTPAPATLAARDAGSLVIRRDELHRLVATAPGDQHAMIDRLTHSHLDAAELHEHLVAAMQAQNQRRDWIIANWPHLVELEQINALIATREPLAHWPAALPEAVRDVLDQLRELAIEPDVREERTLAELDQLAEQRDPVRRLEARHDQLGAMTSRALTPEERDALHAELTTTRSALCAAREHQSVDQTFRRYHPDPLTSARAARIATITHDALVGHPEWLIAHIVHLHDSGHLSVVDHQEIAAHAIGAAVHLDERGDLPPEWPAVEIAPSGPVATGLEISL